MGFLVLFLIAGGFLHLRNRTLMESIKERLEAGSVVLTTPAGNIEYAVTGIGPPVLLIHATGGGYDQGLLLGRTWVGTGYTFLAPSRFGYLRSSVPDQPSVELQAEMFKYLLDSLGIHKVVVVAMSAGGPSAMQFAIRHPDRVAALVLLSSAAYAPPRYPNTTRELPSASWVYDLFFSSDLLFGLLATYDSPMIEEAFGATDEITATLPEDERNIAHDIVQGMLPISLRSEGLKLDKAFVDTLRESNLTAIKAATLVVSAKDDKVAPYGWGEYTAGKIPGARFILYTKGGHMLLGHRRNITAAVDSLLASVGNW
jgi:2-hydroxy-6-oxonona-2,4-dienedioate hydrolase